MSFPLVIERHIGTEPVQSVNGRDLHAFLQVARDFPTWMRDRIDTFSFSEGVDYEVIPEMGENARGGRPAKEYALSIDMAKELAMVERTPKGREVRLYFIECERRAKEASGQKVPTTFAEALQLAANQQRALTAQQAVIDEQAPKAEFYDKFVDADGLLGYQEAGTAAGCHPNKFCNWLKTNYLFYRGKKLMPRSQYVRMGLFEIKPDLDTEGEAHLRGWVTAKGVEYLAKRAPDRIRISARNSEASQ